MKHEKRKPVVGATGNLKASSLDSDERQKDTGKRYPSQAKWRAANPVKRWAHMATQSALRMGILVREPCEVCGAIESEAHHPRHNEPLLVRWLCRKHHKAEESRLRHLRKPDVA